MLTDTCKDHLFNWRFQRAADDLVREIHSSPRISTLPTEDEKDLIRALSRAFGDVVPFGGAQGEIVRAAVRLLVGPDYEGEINQAAPTGIGQLGDLIP